MLGPAKNAKGLVAVSAPNDVSRLMAVNAREPKLRNELAYVSQSRRQAFVGLWGTAQAAVGTDAARPAGAAAGEAGGDEELKMDRQGWCFGEASTTSSATKHDLRT